MPRQRTVDYTVLDLEIFQSNATTDTYIKLFEHLRNINREIPLKRDNYLHLYSLKAINPDSPINGFKGVIFKRNGLPKDWYNVLEEKRSLNTDMEKEFIPQAWKANVRFFDFVFYPLQRKIVCEIKHQFNNISPSVIEEFFKYLLETEELAKLFDRIEVNIVKEKLCLKDILETPQLTYLEMNISEYNQIEPNASSLEKDIFEEIQESNVKKYTKTLTSEKSKFLEISEKIKNLAKIAFENGYIKYKFKNFEEIIETKSSTKSYPLKRRITYDPRIINGYDLLLRDTRKIVEEFDKK